MTWSLLTITLQVVESLLQVKVNEGASRLT